MRQLTSIELERLKLLTENSVELALIEPTQTGLSKSIMDATGPVRSYFKKNNLHDYESQLQGPRYKVFVPSYFVSESKTKVTTASLYRPLTKKGDPRIWFRSLAEFAKPNDILGIIFCEFSLYIINITRLDIDRLLSNKLVNPLKDLVDQLSSDSSSYADELLAKLKRISRGGPVPAMLTADTAIGRTLENVLGIPINSSKKPDYKGIEIKSYRDARNNRKNLFAQVPDWEISKYKSSAEILSKFGYARGANTKLYCTVSAITRNSQGLKLKINSKANLLLENSDKPEIGDFVSWQLERLHKRLLEKHNETFWVAAESVKIGEIEHFLFKKVEHTKKPLVSQFDVLLEQGYISLDHLIKKDPSGRVVEKGPLFKIEQNGLGLLFPPSRIYELM